MSWSRPHPEPSTADRPDPIASTRNLRVAAAVRLHRGRERAAVGRALIEGPTLLSEAVEAGAVIETVFHLASDPVSGDLAVAAHANPVPVTAAVLDRLATTSTPQSPISVIEISDDVVPATGDLLVAWGVGDPGNVGTLIRTAAAFGMAFVAGPGSADLWSPKVLRAGAGAHFRVPVARVADLAAISGRIMVATVAGGGIPPNGLPDADVAIMVGDEAHGLPVDVVDAADLAVTIPMPGGTESLNAAVAGAIVAYEAAARRA